MGFTKAMVTRLAELVKDNEALLFPNSRTKDANKRQDEIWNFVATTLNSENPENNLTVVQIKTKWKNLKAESKENAQVLRKAAEKTGGGSPIKEFSEASKIVQQMYSNRHSFNGVPGSFETNLFCCNSSLNYQTEIADNQSAETSTAASLTTPTAASLTTPTAASLTTPTAKSTKLVKRSLVEQQQLSPKRMRHMPLEDLQKTVLEQELMNGKKMSAVLDAALKFFNNASSKSEYEIVDSVDL